MTSEHVAIKVDSISKLYRIGFKEHIHDSLMGTLVDFVRSPLRNYRKYRSLYRFDDTELEASNHNADNSIIWALRDVSLEVKRGEVLGIIGRNGAGKSTLLKILSRITDPTLGTAQIFGRVSSLLEVGTGFHQELTGRENVYLNGTILGMKKTEIDSKFEEIVDFSGIEKFIDTPVKRYSSGMRVRLAFSVAAHLDPDILIIDEVLAVGDADFQRKCLNKMEDVGSLGRTVLFVSHNMPAVTRLCGRAIHLDEGMVVADGPSQEIVRSYLTSDLGTTAVHEWVDPAKAPGGDIVRLRRVRVVKEDGQITDNVDIRESFRVEMEYDVLKAGYILAPQIGFLTEEGQLAFVTLEQDPDWRGRTRPAGRYTSMVWIPGNLLAEGMHFCHCALRSVNPDHFLFIERSVVAFLVSDTTDGNSARGDYPTKIYGVVRPLLKWTTGFDPDLRR